ncbi:MAG: hypothetical protein M3514_10440 [Actinomycetota bacterium]|nr:hypothetical protein [Actinomycetota bacterium]
MGRRGRPDTLFCRDRGPRSDRKRRGGRAGRQAPRRRDSR